MREWPPAEFTVSAFGKASGGGRRGSTRELIPFSILLRTRLRTYEAHLIDISTYGARVGASELPALGEELYLCFSQVKTFCTVKWRNDRECGLQFYEPLLPRDVIGLRRAWQGARG